MTPKILKKLRMPDFYPDATKGVIRGVDSEDLSAARVNGIIVNTYHLLTQPGPSVLDSIGGIKKYMDWDGVVISDSGGWQMFSLIHQRSGLGTISRDGVTFFKTTKAGRHKYKITPEKCIQIQFAIGSDIIICLDYFTPYGAPIEETKLSVDRTLEWARRCKEEYLKLCKQKKLNEEDRPLIFGVLQGGRVKDEVTRCAEGLKKIGFDGYGLGGWLFGEDGDLDLDICKHYSKNMEEGKPKYALGVGNPQAVVDCVKLGFGIFDCVLPTRDARHKRLYVFTKDPKRMDFEEEGKWYDYVYIVRGKYVRDSSPISEYCDCYTCTNYSKAYLRHLFEIEDTLAYRLATIHNLRMYSILMERLREKYKALFIK